MDILNKFRNSLIEPSRRDLKAELAVRYYLNDIIVRLRSLA